MKQTILIYTLAALAGIFLSFTEPTINWQYWAFIVSLTAMNIVVGKQDFQRGYDKALSDTKENK